MSKQIHDFELNEISASTYMLTCCSSCKNLVPYGNYCVACGSLMQKDMRTLEIITCPNCKKSTPIKGNYCVACGKPIKIDPFYSKENTKRLKKNAEEMDRTGGTIHEVD